jgi:zinc protease
VVDKFADWLALDPTAEGSKIEAPSPSSRAIHVIARPEATQSILRVGKIATKRDTPDYCVLVLLNTIIGGQFSSRLNEKLREEQGFTYGVSSSFVLRKATGSFLAGTDVDGRVTREALRSMIEVILGPAGDRPVTAEELSFAKAYIIRRFPARFETQGSILGQIAHTVVYDLPDNYFETYLDRLAAVTLDDIRKAAEKYLSIHDLKIVVVGRPEDTEGLGEISDILG